MVVDLELYSPYKNVFFDLADSILWTFVPMASSLRSTLSHFEALQNQKYVFQKVSFVLNHVGLPGSIDPNTVQSAIGRFGKPLTVQLPYEPEFARMANQGRPGIIEIARNPYLHALAPLLDKLSKIKMDAPGTPGTASGPHAGPPTTIVGNRVVETMLDEKRKRWNAMKQGIHRDLVEELNIRRIDLNTKGDPALERQLRTHVESTVNALITKDKDLNLPREERERLVKELVDETLGLGPLEELLDGRDHHGNHGEPL